MSATLQSESSVKTLVNEVNVSCSDQSKACSLLPSPFQEVVQTQQKERGSLLNLWWCSEQRKFSLIEWVKGFLLLMKCGGQGNVLLNKLDDEIRSITDVNTNGEALSVL